MSLALGPGRLSRTATIGGIRRSVASADNGNLIRAIKRRGVEARPTLTRSTVDGGSFSSKFEDRFCPQDVLR